MARKRSDPLDAQAAVAAEAELEAATTAEADTTVDDAAALAATISSLTPPGPSGRMLTVEGTVFLRNRDRRPFVTTLTHDAYCARGGACACTVEHFLNPMAGRDGAVRLRRDRRVNPRGVSILPGDREGPFHPCVVNLDGVRSHVAANLLIVEPA